MKREAGQVVPPPFFPLSGKSGQSDGGRPAGRVLACLYNPGIPKKVPAKPKKLAKIWSANRRPPSGAKAPMPRPSQLSPDNILRFLQVRSAPVSASDIAQGLHLRKSDNRPLFKMLSKLKKRRAIEELPGGRYRLPSRKSDRDVPSQKPSGEASRRPQPTPLSGRDEVKGRLVLHHDGYGFVVPDSPMPQLDGDVFIPRDGIQD